MSNLENLKLNILAIKDKVSKIANLSNRSEKDIQIIAVTKTVTVDRIIDCINNGILTIGENKVQELLGKYESLQNQCDIHFIGHLQSNKVKYIIDKVSLIHSVDSLNLAKEINRHAKKHNKIIHILIQVNISKEESKFGVYKSNLLPLVKNISNFENVKITGLMTIPPYYNEPTKVRPLFRELKLTFDELKSLNINNTNFKHLSMGMSGDFESAILEGSTIVRIGSSIFGERIY